MGYQSKGMRRYDLGYPTSGISGPVTTAQTIGSAASLPIGPYLADHFGWQLRITIGSLLVILAASIQGGCKHFDHACCISSKHQCGQRLRCHCCFSLIAEIAHSWRIPYLLQALPSVIQLAFISFVPESPRWFMANIRRAEAEHIPSRYHAGTDQPNELVRIEMEEIARALEDEKSQQTASYLDFIQTPANRHRLLICVPLGFIIQWCGNGLVSYYLVPVLKNIGITDPEMQNTINGMLQIFKYFTAIAAACFVDRVGRRSLFIISTAGATHSFVIWTAVSAVTDQQNQQKKGLGIGVVIMIFVFFFYNIAMNPVPMTYLLKILPFTLRAKVLTIFNPAQYGSSIFNGFANPVELDALVWRYYSVFTCLAAIWFVFIWFVFLETKGMSLEEVAVKNNNTTIHQTYSAHCASHGDSE
ncbi:hypothetical protein BDV12DRAFT_187622 [Aspergillus spectabilis]